jgi:signal transduction histidine kinase
MHDELERRGEVKLLGVASAIWLGVPLIVEGKTIGAMVLQHYTDPMAYGEREQHMLEFVSTQVAIAINRLQAEQEIRSLNTELEKRVVERTRELRLAQDKIVRQEKLALLGQLAGGVGHELRNPLGIISNAIYYLKYIQPDADEKVKQYHAMIDQEVRNSDKIITDLLDFARLEAVDREPVSVRELVQRTLTRFPVPESIQTTLKISEDLPKVFADMAQMEQVLGNLTVNACQAMVSPRSPEGVAVRGTTPLDSTKPGGKGGELTITAHRHEEMVAIAVKDSGVGITPENMAKIFEPLFTTKSKGIGLGLAVSRKLTEANGGRIEVKSELGKGSTFTLILPVEGK